MEGSEEDIAEEGELEGEEKGWSSAQRELYRILNRLYEGFAPVDIREKRGGGCLDILPLEPYTPKHPNLSPLYGVLEGEDAVYLVHGASPHTLESLIKFNFHTLRSVDDVKSSRLILGSRVTAGNDVSDVALKFIFYQLLQTLDFVHRQGLWHGALCTFMVHISSDLWLRLDPPQTLLDRSVEDIQQRQGAPRLQEAMQQSLSEQWRQGLISNFDYLMAINAAAGRRMGDPTFHPIIPWVTDFSSQDEDEDAKHWRDLGKSKFRLAKGDHQLLSTFVNSPIPHHITESLSEITYYIYMARRTPLSTLRSVVRSNFEAKEYPQSMQRMYEWTPDECIPEFFTDESVFESIHKQGSGMADLQLPAWCSTPAEFVSWHMKLLESPVVSAKLHEWIDLNFGVGLDGSRAVEAMNVSLPVESLPSYRLRKNPGFVQVFTLPHPPKIIPSLSKQPSEEDIRCNSAFALRFAHFLSPAYYPSVPVTEATHPEDHPDKAFVQQLQSEDIFAAGCVLVEMYLQEPLATNPELRREKNLHGNARLERLPQIPRRLVQGLLSRSLDAGQALSHAMFAPCFPKLYQFLSSYQLLNKWPERLDYFATASDQILHAILPEQLPMVVDLLVSSSYKTWRLPIVVVKVVSAL